MIQSLRPFQPYMTLILRGLSLKTRQPKKKKSLEIKRAPRYTPLFLPFSLFSLNQKKAGVGDFVNELHGKEMGFRVMRMSDVGR